jgi:glycosyltransferase involved in cell wall biosynthesis
MAMSDDKRKKVSIIIPVYNHSGALRKCLDSLKQQTFTDFEIIIIDDGSEDGIDYVIHEYDEDLVLRVYAQENKGAPAARNRGFELSSGEYVIFWDADVVGTKDILEKMVKKLDRNEGIDFAYCNFNIGKKAMKAQSFNEEELKKQNYIHSTTLIRRKNFTRWDEALKRFQDWDVWLTMASKGRKGIWIDEFLFTIVASGSMSQWLPRFAYKKPWKYLPWFKESVERYEKARKLIYRKHKI